MNLPLVIATIAILICYAMGYVYYSSPIGDRDDDDSWGLTNPSNVEYVPLKIREQAHEVYEKSHPKKQKSVPNKVHVSPIDQEQEMTLSLLAASIVRLIRHVKEDHSQVNLSDDELWQQRDVIHLHDQMNYLFEGGL